MTILTLALLAFSLPPILVGLWREYKRQLDLQRIEQRIRKLRLPR